MNLDVPAVVDSELPARRVTLIHTRMAFRYPGHPGRRRLVPTNEGSFAIGACFKCIVLLILRDVEGDND